MGSHLSDIVGTRHAHLSKVVPGESCVEPGVGTGKRGSFGAGVSRTQLGYPGLEAWWSFMG